MPHGDVPLPDVIVSEEGVIACGNQAEAGFAWQTAYSSAMCRKMWPAPFALTPAAR